MRERRSMFMANPVSPGGALQAGGGDPYDGPRQLFRFLRDEGLDDADDATIDSTVDEGARRGMAPDKLMLTGLEKAQSEMVRDRVARRTKATDAYGAEMKAAEADATPTKGQQIAGFIADALNSLRGGNPGEMMQKLQTMRDQRRAGREKRAQGALQTELGALESESDDRKLARDEQTFGMAVDERQRGLDSTAATAQILVERYPNLFKPEMAQQNPAGVVAAFEKLAPQMAEQIKAEAAAKATKQKQDFDAEQNRLGREATIKAAEVRAGAKGQTSPTERKAAQASSEELVPAISRTRARIDSLKQAKKLWESLWMTGSWAGPVGNLGGADAREQLKSLLGRIRIGEAPQGQGSVSNYERSLYASGVPGEESDAAGEIYDRLIREGLQAIADDESRLRELETITGRTTPRGVVPAEGGGAATGAGQQGAAAGGTITYVINDQGDEIDVEPSEVPELLRQYKNARRK